MLNGISSTHPWYSPYHYFSADRLKNTLVESLFTGQTHVWNILDALSPFIKEKIQANVKLLRSESPLILEATALLPNGDFYKGVMYQIEDCSKGRMQIFHNNQELKGAALIMPGAILTDDNIQICPGALVEGGATIKGPSIIGPQSEVRQGAYVRGAVMSLPGSIIGHATEAKNTLLLEGAKAGHFAYLGDSILGFDVNLGAGTKLANLKMNCTPYIFRHDGENITVKRKKFGAVIGDNTETGCNSVTNPGTLLSKNCKIMPNSSVSPGYHKEGIIYK